MTPPRTTVVDISALCFRYLELAESLFAIVHPKMLAMQTAFRESYVADSVLNLLDSPDVMGQIQEIQRQRRAVLDEIGSRLGLKSDVVTLSSILGKVPVEARSALVTRADRLRRMTAEIASINLWLAVHLRVHLDAYQRLLVAITGTAAGSGRYGARGKAESFDFRPTIEKRG